MAGIPRPQSYPQFLGQSISTVTSKTGIAKLRVGGPLLSILEAAAQADVRSTKSVFDALQSKDLDNAEGDALVQIGISEGVPKRLLRKATGVVTFTDTSFTKRASKVYQGTAAPIVGSTSLNVDKSDTFDLAPSNGQVYVGRETPDVEGPLTYTAKTDAGAYWILALSTPTSKFHNKGEGVILAQGGNRLINAGTLVQTPQGALATAVQFSTVFDATLPDGETVLTSIDVVASVAGAAGKAPANTVTEFVGAPPFPGATVNNPLPFINGRDTETDNDYRERIRNTRAAKALTGGNDQSLKNAVIGASAPDENKEVSSASVVRKASGPDYLIIDDGTGYEEISKGVGLEVAIESATGGELDFASLGKPVTKAFVVSANAAPFTLQDSAQLTVDVGGVQTTHSFDSSEFQSIASASAYEVVASINGNPSIGFSARTLASGTKVVLFARAETNEDLQVMASTGIDAAPAFDFPESRHYTALLYKNDRLLSKDGAPAAYRSNRFSQWNNFVGAQTLTIAVDQTPAQTYTFVDQDFVDASTGFSIVGKNSLVSWATVINRKIPGITATVELDLLVLTSNLAHNAVAKIDIQGGTLVSNLAFAVGTATGRDADYTLDRATGQFFLDTAAVSGDRFTLGSEWTRAFLESDPIPATTLSTDGTLWLAVDGLESIIPHSLGASTPVSGFVYRVTDSGFLVKFRAESTTECFARVQPGDWAVFYDPTTLLPAELRTAFRVIDVLPDESSLKNDLLLEKRALNAARFGAGAVALPAGKVLVCGGYTEDVGNDLVNTGTRQGRGTTSTVEIWDPATSTWSYAAPMASARARHTTTLLASGKVLVCGGYDETAAVLNTTEIYDPGTDTWTPGPNMASGRVDHIAVKLTSGRVLVAGGYNGTVAVNTSEEFNPGTSTFINATTFTTARYGAAAVLVPAGTQANNVIMCGGASGASLTSVQLYDTTATTWSALASMPSARANFGVAITGTNQLMVVGDGEDIALAGNQGKYALYNISTNSWGSDTAILSGGNPFYFQDKAVITLTPSGDVLAFYGFVDNGTTKRCHSMRYDVSVPAWVDVSGTSLFQQFAGIEKVMTSAVQLQGLTEVAMVLGGSSTGNLVSAAGVKGVAAGHHEQYDAIVDQWAWPDLIDVLGASIAVLPARGLSIVRTKNYLQKATVPAATNYTAPTFAAAINNSLEGAEALVYRTSKLRLSTNTFDLSGDISVVASDISGPVPILPDLLPIPQGVVRNLTGHFASVESGHPGVGTPQNFEIQNVLYATPPHISDAVRTAYLTPYQRPRTGSVLLGLKRWRDGLTPAQWNFGIDGDLGIEEWGNQDHLRSAVATFDILGDSFRVGLRKDPFNSLVSRTPAILATPYAVGPEDTLTAVVDGDNETKRFVVPMFRKLLPSNNTYGQQVSLQDADAGIVTLSTTFGQFYDFNDFALYMRARGKTHGADSTRSVLWRYFRHGAEGNDAVVRYIYADAPDAVPAFEVRLDQDSSLVGYGKSEIKANVDIKLGSGAAKTSGTLRTSSRVALARTNPTSLVWDSYVIAGYQVVEAERTLAGGTTRLRLQVPNNGVVAQGPQDTGLVAGNVLWFEATTPSATTLLSGAFAIASVGSFNAGTGQQDVFVPANTLDDGTSTLPLTATPGTVSFDSTGEVVFDPSTAIGDMYRINDTVNGGAYAGITSRVAGFGRQYLRLRALESFPDGSAPIPTFISVIDPTLYLHFRAPTQTATAVVAAVNAFANCPVSGTVLGTGTGVLALASWDEANVADAGTSLVDGLNFVQRTVAPPLPTQQTQFLLRNPVDATILTGSDWQNEDVRICPILTSDVVQWLNTPAVSGLFTSAEVVASSDGTKVQVSSLTAGSGGSVEIQGGTANTATASVVGASTLISRVSGFNTSVVTTRVSETSGFRGGDYVVVNNAEVHPRVQWWGSGTTVTVDTSGNWSFTASPYTVNATVTNARIQVEKVGDFVAIHYPFACNETAFSVGDVLERDVLYIRGRDTQDSALPSVASANQGVFRVVRVGFSDLGCTFWIENKDAIEETSECYLKILDHNATIPGDTWVVSTPRFGLNNKLAWTITEVGSTTPGGPQFVDPSFRVSLAQGRPQAVTTAVGPDSALLQVLEGTPARMFKRIATVTPNLNPDFIDIQFDSDRGFDLVGGASGSVVSSLDKLQFPLGTFIGVDGYANSVGLVGEATKIIYGDDSDPDTYPGYVATGGSVVVAGPKVKRVKIALGLRVRSGLESQDLADRVRSEVATVINQSDVGASAAISDVVAAAGRVGGVVAVSVISPTYSTSSDVIPAAADEKLLVLDLRADISVSFVGV